MVVCLCTASNLRHLLLCLIDWADWWSAPWSSQERKKKPDRCHDRQPQGKTLAQRVWGSGRFKVCAAVILLRVCVFMAICLHYSRASDNQSTLILYTGSPDGCPRLLVDRVYSCFPSADSSHPGGGSSAEPAADTRRFQGSKINHQTSVW